MSMVSGQLLIILIDVECSIVRYCKIKIDFSIWREEIQNRNRLLDWRRNSTFNIGSLSLWHLDSYCSVALAWLWYGYGMAMAMAVRWQWQ